MTVIAYEMRIAGSVPDLILDELDDLEVTAEPGATVLRGTAVDQSALHGIFNRVHFMGLELLDFHRMGPPRRR